MKKLLQVRLAQGHRTEARPEVPANFPGRPEFQPERCVDGCTSCAETCPTGALQPGRLDLGACLFCQECVPVCPAVRFTPEFRLAVRRREDLWLEGDAYRLAEALDEKARRLFGHSLKLRQVSAGGCNGCEAELNALSNVVFDLGRFGVQMVASPRHADGLLITGPVTEAMREALLKTYRAVPEPRLVIAVGACALSGGPYRDHPEAHNGADSVVPVDLYVPGCPPHPATILDGLLRLLGRL